MSMPLSSTSKRTQVVLTCLFVMPWTIISVVWLGLLPQGWRFERWPALLQAISIAICVLFCIADALFTAWYFLALVADAYAGKSDESA